MHKLYLNIKVYENLLCTQSVKVFFIEIYIAVIDLIPSRPNKHLHNFVHAFIPVVDKTDSVLKYSDGLIQSVFEVKLGDTQINVICVLVKPQIGKMSNHGHMNAAGEVSPLVKLFRM